MTGKIRISEIFYSLQGESATVGFPTVFVRLTGCPLRCQYCDTAYAFSGGNLLEMNEIIAKIKSFNCNYVCVTGGEPLAQQLCINLLQQLSSEGLAVSLETSGARDISQVDKKVMIVMDIKTPDSGESDKNRLENLQYLKASDQIKFVLCSRRDYEWACTLIQEQRLDQICQLLFSPSWNQLNATTLADWIISDNLPVRFQLQLHKILWDDAPGR